MAAVLTLRQTNSFAGVSPAMAKFLNSPTECATVLKTSSLVDKCEADQPADEPVIPMSELRGRLRLNGWLGCESFVIDRAQSVKRFEAQKTTRLFVVGRR